MDVHSGETLLFEGHPSWRSILGFYLGGIVLGVAIGVVAALVGLAAGLAVVLFLGVVALTIVAGFLKRIDTTYAISDQRLRIRRGLLSRHVQECRLERVQNVNTNQSFFERVLGVGTVDFDTAGSADSDFRFVGVADPDGIAGEVDRAMRAGGGAPAPLGPGGGGAGAYSASG